MFLEDKALALGSINDNSFLDCPTFISLSNYMEISSCLLGIILERLSNPLYSIATLAFSPLGKLLAVSFPLPTANLYSYPRGCTVSGGEIGKKSAQYLQNAPS